MASKPGHHRRRQLPDAAATRSAAPAYSTDSKPCCSCRRRHPDGRQHRTRQHGVRLRPDGERARALDQRAIASIDHARPQRHVNLIDTPGYPISAAPPSRALAAVETCAVVVNAATGIEHGTARMMDYAKARGLCRVLVVNKIDHEGADLARWCSKLRETFGNECCRSTCRRQGHAVVDCFFNTTGEATFPAWPRRTSASSTRWSRSTKR
jgi:hypothetical protein